MEGTVVILSVEMGTGKDINDKAQNCTAGRAQALVAKNCYYDAASEEQIVSDVAQMKMSR